MSLIWSICIATPSYLERLNFSSTKKLTVNENFSSFRPKYMAAGFNFDVCAIMKLFEILENRTVLALTNNYVQKDFQVFNFFF